LRRLAGSLKRELKTKYAITPKMKHAYHELEVLVDGQSVFCYSLANRIPTVESLLAAVEESAGLIPSEPKTHS
jgi:hypothetical protein